MIRMQIQLTEEQATELRRRAHARRVSIAAVVRDAIDRDLARDDRTAAKDRALAAVGKYRGGGGDVSTNHDAYLDEEWDH